MTVSKAQVVPDVGLEPRPDGDLRTASADVGGLSSGDAAARLARDGGNVLPTPRPTPLWRRIVTQLRDPLVLVLLAAAGFTLATADFTDAAVILLVIAATGADSPPTASAVVSAGTVVVRGRGRAVITATGAASAMGRIAAMMVTSPGLTPLQRRLAGVGRQLAVGALLLCGLVLALGLLRGQPLQLMIVTAISLVVAAVPESLPWPRST